MATDGSLKSTNRQSTNRVSSNRINRIHQNQIAEMTLKLPKANRPASVTKGPTDGLKVLRDMRHQPGLHEKIFKKFSSTQVDEGSECDLSPVKMQKLS